MPTLDEAIALKVEELKGKPVRVGQDIPNPNITYGSLYGDEELKIAVLKASPILQQRVRGIKGDAAVDEEIRRFDEEIKPRRTSRYLRPPLPLTEADIFPDYAARLQRYDQDVDRSRRMTLYERGNLPESFLIPEPPRKPFGYDIALAQAKRGIDPRKELDVPGIAKFRIMQNFLGPYTQTPETLNYAAKYRGTSLASRTENPDVRGPFADLFPGTFAYVDPNNPDLGTAYFEEGKEPRIYDSALLTGTDVLETVAQEAPVIATELLIGMKGLKYFDEFLKTAPAGKNLANKAFEGTAGNILLSGGAAATRFLQLLSGSFIGVHNRDVYEMLKESGMLALVAFAGNTAISGFMNGLPKLYRGISGKDLSATDIKKIEEALQVKRKSQLGKKVKTRVGEEPVSLLEINEALAQLSSEVERELTFKPTLAQASKDSFIADIEDILRRNIDNPEYGKLYKEMLEGNEQVTQDFFDILFDKLNDDTTGATVAKSLANLFGRKSNALQDEGNVIIARMAADLDNMKSAAGGKQILDKVDDLEASSKLIPRFTKRVQKISRNYRTQLKEDVDDAFNIPELKDLTFTGRGFRNEIAEFQRAGQPTGEMNIGRATIKKQFNEIFEPEVLERLTRYKNGELTLRELNHTRTELNRFASGLDPKKVSDQKMFELTRTIQDAMEESMFRNLRKSLPKDQADFVIETLNTHKYGMELANQQVIKNLTQTQPEGVIGYLFGTGVKGAPENTVVQEFMNFLKATKSHGEINTLRNGTIDYIKRNFLDNVDLTPVQLSKNYAKFIDQNRGTLRAIFPEKEFKGIIRTRKDFDKNIIKPLERIERKNTLLEAKFGDDNPYNIVTEILGTGKTKKASGQIIDDLDFIDDLLDAATDAEREILEKQLSDATKKYIIQISSVDGKFNVNMLNKFMNEGFAPAALVGKDLSFKGTIGRLIQDKDSFFKNLDVLRDMGMRTQVDLTSESALRAQIREKATNPGTEYLRRFFIPPLTQFGRRTTALENLLTERNLRFLSDVVTNDDLFRAYVDTIRGTKTLANFIKVLNTQRLVYARDIGSTAKFYDTAEKEQRPSRKQTLDSIARDELMNLRRIGAFN